MNPGFGIPNAGIPNAYAPGAGAGKLPFLGGLNLAGLPFGNILGNQWILLAVLAFFLLPTIRSFGTFFNKNVIWIFLALIVFFALTGFGMRK